jgi:zinc protease
VDTLLKALHAEIEKLQVDGPTAKDLDKVKTARLESHREAIKTNGYWLEILINEHFYPQDRAMTSTYEAAIEGVTSEQLRVLAQDVFSSENVFRGILYPAK